MSAVEWIRLIIGCLFILVGMVIFFTELFGVFHFNYVLNRMHAAAMGDTLGISACLIGLMIFSGLRTAKYMKMWKLSRENLPRQEKTAIPKKRRRPCHDRFSGYFDGTVDYLCGLCQLFQKFIKFHFDLYVIQSGYVHALDLSGVTSVLFFVTLKKIHAIDASDPDAKEEKENE